MKVRPLLKKIMKTPKSLEKLAEAAGLFIEPLKFYATMGGPTKKGFAIVDKDNNEIAEIEPVFYRNGDRWKISNRSDEAPSLSYLKSLKGIDKKFTGKLKAGHTGYKFRTMTTNPKCRTIGGEILKSQAN